MDAAKPKVLIIEDNIVNAKLLTIILQEQGYDVVHAINGYTGLEAARSQPDIDAVFLDRIMPDMDGLDVLRSLKLGSHSSNLPVIMLTAFLSKKQIEEAKTFGAYACLLKPYNKEKIIATVGEAIKNRRRS